MIITKKNARITKQDILDKVGSEAIYRAELGDIKIGRAMCNSLRKDKNPSFSIFWGDDNQLHHIDYADDRFKGSCIELVMQKYSITYREAIDKIARDWGLVEGQQVHHKVEVAENRQIQATKRKCLIQVQTRQWQAKDTKYWSQYGISKEVLRNDRVYPISELYIERQREQLLDTEVAYVYEYDSGLKVYLPMRLKDLKWKGNISTKLVEALDKVNGHEKVMIHKAKKDRLLHEILYPEIAHINLQNERAVNITAEIKEKLEGKQVWVAMDIDETGKRESMKLTQTHIGWKHINVPDHYMSENIKDWSDLYKVYGRKPIDDHYKLKGLIT